MVCEDQAVGEGKGGFSAIFVEQLDLLLSTVHSAGAVIITSRSQASHLAVP